MVCRAVLFVLVLSALFSCSDKKNDELHRKAMSCGIKELLDYETPSFMPVIFDNASVSCLAEIAGDYEITVNGKNYHKVDLDMVNGEWDCKQLKRAFNYTELEMYPYSLDTIGSDQMRSWHREHPGTNLVILQPLLHVVDDTYMFTISVKTGVNSGIGCIVTMDLSEDTCKIVDYLPAPLT